MFPLPMCPSPEEHATLLRNVLQEFDIPRGKAKRRGRARRPGRMMRRKIRMRKVSCKDRPSEGRLLLLTYTHYEL